MQRGDPFAVLGVYLREIGPGQQRQAHVREGLLRSKVKRGLAPAVLGVHLREVGPGQQR